MVHWIIQKTDFWCVPSKSKTKSKSIKTQTLAKIFQVYYNVWRRSSSCSYFYKLRTFTVFQERVKRNRNVLKHQMISKVHFNVHAVSPSTYLMYLFKMGTFHVYRERHSAKLNALKHKKQRYFKIHFNVYTKFEWYILVSFKGRY